MSFCYVVGMEREDYDKLIEIIKEKYIKIGYIRCPAFSYEKIYFNKFGFNHLLRKGKVFRSMAQQKRRIELFDSVKSIILNSNTFSEYKILNNKEKPAQFWSLIDNKDNRYIKVIIRQIGNGNKHFFSVMDGDIS